jgi:hypothetical protein
MHRYHQREVKDLYRLKDIMFVIIGLVCTITAALVLSRAFTGWAGI